MLFLKYKAWNILYLLNEFLVNSLIYCIWQKSLVSARRELHRDVIHQSCEIRISRKLEENRRLSKEANQKSEDEDIVSIAVKKDGTYQKQ